MTITQINMILIVAKFGIDLINISKDIKQSATSLKPVYRRFFVLEHRLICNTLRC